MSNNNKLSFLTTVTVTYVKYKSKPDRNLYDLSLVYCNLHIHCITSPRCLVSIGAMEKKRDVSILRLSGLCHFYLFLI